MEYLPVCCCQCESMYVSCRGVVHLYYMHWNSTINLRCVHLTFTVHCVCVSILLSRCRHQPTDPPVFGHLPLLGVWCGQEIHEAKMQTCWSDRQENTESCNNCGSECGTLLNEKYHTLVQLLCFKAWVVLIIRAAKYAHIHLHQKRQSGSFAIIIALFIIINESGILMKCD